MDRTTLLVPLDGSPLALAALPYAEAVARATDASLRLLAVVERETPGMRNWPETVQTYLEQSHAEGFARHLSETAALLRGRGLSVSCDVSIGNAADEIIAAADAADVCMTVMATHGLGGLRRAWIGSVADKVMRLGRRPTLLIRPAESEHPERVTLRRIMVPLDGSPLAEEALPLAGELARASDAEVVLVRVERYITTGLAPYGTTVSFVEMEAEVEAEAKSYLTTVRQRLPADVRSRVIVARGFSDSTLIEVAQHEAVDLVVMTTHGRGGVRRLVLGSTADHMVRGGVPTLLVRPNQVPASDAVTAAVASNAIEREPAHAD